MKIFRLLFWAVAASLAFTACSDDENTDPDGKTYKVTITAGENGAAAADKAEAEAGERITLTATPDEGFVFVSWSVESGEVTLSDATVNPVEFTMPAGDVRIKASFAEEEAPTFAITLAATENGTIQSNPQGEAAEGATVRLLATAAEGYEFRGWTIEGVEIGDLLANPLEFTMPANEVKVNAEFAEPVDVLSKIPDEVFKAYVRERMSNSEKITNPLTQQTETSPAWDLNSDGILSDTEAARVRFIVLDGGYTSPPDGFGESEYKGALIEQLTGIEYFTGLEVLDLGARSTTNPYVEGYTTIDLSKLEKLVYLRIQDGNLYTLNFILGNKPELKTLDLAYSDIWGEETPVVDVTRCPKLTYIDLRGSYFDDPVDITHVEDVNCVCRGEKKDTVWLIRADQEAGFKATNHEQTYEIKK